MGIFSNRCEALVNPVTGHALYGKALEDARKDPSWPRCGASVKKSAHCCSRCGAPAPGGWWKCPSCGEWVGNDSHFCPYCNAPLHPDERTGMSGGVWDKRPEVYAERFEIGDIDALAKLGLQVQEGTAAILLNAGAVQDVLSAGAYEVEKLSQKNKWFSNPAPRSVIVVDAGEVAVPLFFDEVRTKEQSLVKFYGEVILQFTGGKDAGVAFTANVMRQAREVSFANLAERFEPLFRLAVEDTASMATIDDLIRDPERRTRLRDTMTRILEDDLRSTGLDVVRVSSGEFTSPAYEKRVNQLGELDVRRRQAEADAEVKKFESEQMLSQLRDEYALRRAKEAMEHEFRIAEQQRQESWARIAKQREDALKAQEEEKAEAQRQRDAVERVRAQKEADEARIREQARQDEERDRRWTLEEQSHTHERKIQLTRQNEALADRRRKWADEREIREQWWAKTQEIWKQQDANRERARKIGSEDRAEETLKLEHELSLARMRMEDQLARRKAVNDAQNAEALSNAQSKVAVDTVIARGGVDIDVIKAKGKVDARKLEHDQEVAEAVEALRLQDMSDEMLKAERREIEQKMDELVVKAADTDEFQKKILSAKLSAFETRIKDINEELRGRVVC